MPPTPGRPNTSAADRAIELDEAVAARLVAGTHRIPGVEVDAFGAARERAPGPDPQVLRRDGSADTQRHGTEAALQLADPEAAPAAAVAGGAREVQQRGAPRHVA